MKITANTAAGQILLALRAGKMAPGELHERFSNVSGWLVQLLGLGYVGRTGTQLHPGSYFLTAAGRAACPTRRKEKEAA